ncbi:MAG: DinB family protein [Armatimonadota bacterium]|nr:DinB family protein [Armatimonadota bacterium]
MDPLVAPYLRVIGDLRRQLLETVTPLSDEQVNRTVPGLRNSVGILLKHLIGSERYWIGEVAGGRPAHRNRDAEFAAAPVRKPDLLAEIERVAAQTREVLDRLTPADLVQEVEVRRTTGTVTETKAGALLHAAQHLAYHLGQIRYLAKLLQQ